MLCACSNSYVVSSDDGGRYAYNKQPEVCGWNLKKLAEALAPTGFTEEMAEEILAKYVWSNILIDWLW